MCGIVGARDDWLRRQDLEPEAAMQRAVEQLRWRGPDGIGVVRIGDWWLGCARLAITQPGSSQPVVRRPGRYAAVLNGAITNARDLWAELLPRAERRAAPPNDAWLPLLAVERGRPELLTQMRGHHAYAVVDRETGQLVHGRDRYGEKPLLLLCGDESGHNPLAFASTPAALQQLGMPAITTDPAIEPLFRFGFAAFLPQRPGPQLHLREDRCEVRQPSSPPPPLRERVLASVRRCADTSVPAGLFLSGGIDSSCLAAALASNDRSIPAFQFRAAGAPPDEREIARAVAAHCNLPFREVDGDIAILDALPALTRHAGLPLGDPSVLAVHAVARAAANEGIRVLLGGEGADELFFGYRRYRALARLPRLGWLRRTASRWSMTQAARWWRAAIAADPIAELAAVTPPAFSATVLARTAGAEREAAAQTVTQRGAALAELARETDIERYLRLDLLPKVDTATMAAGVEARCPYLEGDPDPTATVTTDLGKRRLRAAFANDLPAQVFRQRKRGFALPLDDWFRADIPWLDLLRDARTLSRPHLCPAGVTAAIDRHRRGQTNLGHGLYLLVAYELFLRSEAETDRI